MNNKLLLPLPCQVLRLEEVPEALADAVNILDAPADAALLQPRFHVIEGGVLKLKARWFLFDSIHAAHFIGDGGHGSGGVGSKSDVSKNDDLSVGESSGG